MNHLKNIIYYCIFNIGILFCYSSYGNITNGIGEYIELGKQVYVVSLSTPKAVTEVKQLLESDTAASVSMRITARKISPRRFITMWLESSTVNTNSDTMGRHIANFSKFGQLFQGELANGDIVSLKYSGKSDFHIYLNNALLGAIDSANSGDFFRVLLAGWLGDIPLSSTLKKSLLSPQNVNPKLLNTYNTLTFPESRKDLALQWRMARQQKQQPSFADEKPADPKPDSTAVEPSPPPPQPRPSTGNKAVAAEKQLPAQTPPAAAKSPAIDNLATYEIAKANLASGKNTPRADSKAVGPTLYLDEESLNVRQQYYQRLTQSVLKYQTLPRKAFQRRLEDNLRVLVSIDRDGHIISLKLTEKSEHKIFNRQAIAAVKKAAPFPKVPRQIPDPLFTFTVPLQYRLPY